MRPFLSGLAWVGLIGSSIASKTTTKVCPIQGPAFPVPTGLRSDEAFQAAMKSFDNDLTQALETGTSAFGSAAFNTSTMSIGMFSVSDEALLYERHYAEPSLRTGNVGTKQPDADSVYRLGSIGKLLTAYTFMIREGGGHLNDPITKYVPELARAASTTASPNGVTPKWDEITLGQLLSHMSGLTEDFGINEQTNQSGLPPLQPNQIPQCDLFKPDGTFIPCRREEYLRGVIAEPALFRSGDTPNYSNNAYEVLGLALANMTGSSLNNLFAKSVVDALGLQHTSASVPNDTSNAVIPANETISGWNSNPGVLSPAGSHFSSTHDLATIGRSILNSTLLAPAVTRRWMKPVAFTSSPNVALGAPWEIFRTRAAGGRIIDMYTKNGGWGAYATVLVLLPDFDVGFSILTASSALVEMPVMVYMLSDMLSAAALPALEDLARRQAEARFAGHYALSSTSAQHNQNSSLTVSTDDQAGLRVTHWISNGTDFLAQLAGGDEALVGGAYVDFRLYPNRLYVGDKQVGFTANWQTMPQPVYAGPLDLNCISWGGLNAATHGNVGLAQFVFDVDPTKDVVVAVQPKALRVSLSRVDKAKA